MIFDLPKFVFVDVAGHSSESSRLVVTQNFESGPPKQRPLQNTDSNRVESLNIMMHKSMERSFLNWYNTDLLGGMSLVRIPHPITGEPTVYKIENENFLFSSVGIDNIQCTLILRSLYD